MRLVLYIFAITAWLHHADGARILALFTHPGKSHHMVFEPLLLKLAERGHEMTVASFFPLKHPPANYKQLSFVSLYELGLETLDVGIYENLPWKYSIPVIGDIIKLGDELVPLAKSAVAICEKLVGWNPLTDVLQKNYDLVIVENFSSDCMLGLLYVYGIKAPVIALSSCNAMPSSAERLGLIDNPSYVPVIASPWTVPMSFMDRLKNTLTYVYMKKLVHNTQDNEKALIEKHYGHEVPLYELSKNISLLMLNIFHPLNGARPLVPGVLEVGGMHLKDRRTELPQFIERFLNESEHGVVLFSFGSLIKTATIPKYKEEIITRALSKLKQRVIWKYEDSAEEGTLTGNILRVRWLPQYELLRHKKVVAFLAHGGLLGMTEAVSAGKPMVVVPFFGDQPSNGAAAEAAGLAKVVSYHDLTEEDLSAALEKVLSAEMRLQARLLSNIWNDRQNAPLETAVYWVERVIRWGPAAKLHSPARDMPFYQVALLDVAAAYIAFVIAVFVAIWLLLTRISRLFVKESKQKLH